MKIIQSLWTKPMFKKQNRNEFDRFDGGWTDKKYNYMSWALSCLQFRKFYDEVELYTDEYGYELLIDRLELPYTKVHVVLDDLNHYHPDLWAIGKLYTYSLQKEPFLHVDGDVYIWRSFCPELEKAGLVTQNLEHNFPYYGKIIKEVRKFFTFIPRYIKQLDSNKDITAINAGIFGGNDIDFIQYYAKEAFEFVNKNTDNLHKINVGIFNTIYEQLLFFLLTKRAQKSIYCLKDNVNENFDGLTDFSGVPRYTHYIHAIGQYKEIPQAGEEIARRLLIDYPEYFFKIDGLLKDLYL